MAIQHTHLHVSLSPSHHVVVVVIVVVVVVIVVVVVVVVVVVLVIAVFPFSELTTIGARGKVIPLCHSTVVPSSSLEEMVETPQQPISMR